MKAKTGVSTFEVETIKAKGPKLPAFEEGKDEMYSYLNRTISNSSKLESRDMGDLFDCLNKR